MGCVVGGLCRDVVWDCDEGWERFVRGGGVVWGDVAVAMFRFGAGGAGGVRPTGVVAGRRVGGLQRARVDGGGAPLSVMIAAGGGVVMLARWARDARRWSGWCGRA